MGAMVSEPSALVERLFRVWAEYSTGYEARRTVRRDTLNIETLATWLFCHSES